jgi:hypothetical protein
MTGRWPGLTSDVRQRIKIELLRGDAQFWKSPDTPDAHRNTMRQALDGVAMARLVAGILKLKYSYGVALTKSNTGTGVGLGDCRGLVALCCRDARPHLPLPDGALLGMARWGERWVVGCSRMKRPSGWSG